MDTASALSIGGQWATRYRGPRMGLRLIGGVCGLALFGLLGGCMMKDTKPMAKVNPVQAKVEIPQDELLDVGIHVFDPGIPPEAEKDEQKQAELGIYPDVRRAEARYFAMLLRNTLESSAQWGAVRVIPANAEFVDVLVTGRIVDSDGKDLALEVSVNDATGRQWIVKKQYKSEADIGSYMTEAALKARDPFQNVYSAIANDMIAARKLLQAADLRDIRRITELRFAQDLAPQVFTGYVAQDAQGRYTVQRLPAEGDPLYERVQRIRERDGALIDTVSDHYGVFADQVSDPYGNWRKYSYDELVKEEKIKSQARTRMAMGVAAILGGIFIPSQCGRGDYNCSRIENAARNAAYVGGLAGFLSGLKKHGEAKIHTAAIKELAQSFQAEVAPQVVEVEGRTLKLTGSAEEQYREWRELLRRLYIEETGGAPDATVAGTPAPSTTPN